jgi:hypothetical protein
MKNPKSIDDMSLRAASPAFVEDDDKCIGIADEIASTQKRINETQANQRAAGQNEQQAERAARVKRLLGDPVPDTADKPRESLSQLVQKLGDLQAAHKIAEQRRAASRVAAAKIICKKAEPEYRERVEAICNAMVVLNTALDQYQTLVNAFEREDVPYHIAFRPMPAVFIGRPNDPQGFIAGYLHEAATYRLIDAKTIPPELRR